MILPVINQAVGLHFAEFGGKGGAVNFEVIGKLLSVERDVEFGIRCTLRNLRGKIGEQTAADCF